MNSLKLFALAIVVLCFTACSTGSTSRKIASSDNYEGSEDFNQTQQELLDYSDKHGISIDSKLYSFQRKQLRDASKINAMNFIIYGFKAYELALQRPNLFNSESLDFLKNALANTHIFIVYRPSGISYKDGQVSGWSVNENAQYAITVDFDKFQSKLEREKVYFALESYQRAAGSMMRNTNN